MSLLRMLIENVRSLHAAITSNDYAVNVALIRLSNYTTSKDTNSQAR